MDAFVEILGYLPVAEAVPYFFFMYVTTIVRMIKTQSSNDVSIPAWAANTVVYGLYILYGLFIVQEWQYITSITMATIGSVAVLVTIIAFRTKNKKTNTEKIEKTEHRHAKSAA